MAEKRLTKEQREQLEGCISVSDGKVTPISREPIPQVMSSVWGELPVSDLHSQREILVNRYHMAMNNGLLSGAQMIAAGIQDIDDRLESMGGIGGGSEFV
jgi:hypothetical protein